MVSGCLLAIARAAGETAPLLFTIGAAKNFNWNVLNGPNTALSYQIFQNAFAPQAGPQERGWGAAFTLVAITFLFTVARPCDHVPLPAEARMSDVRSTQEVTMASDLDASPEPGRSTRGVRVARPGGALRVLPGRPRGRP